MIRVGSPGWNRVQISCRIFILPACSPPTQVLPDWAYYLASLLLLIAQSAAWLGHFFKLPANLILVANAALYAGFFPGKLNGLGFGYGTVAVFLFLAVLGEGLALAARHRRRLARENRLNGLENTLLGAGAGSLVGAVSLFWIPLIGPLIGLAGAVLGAAGGAYIGTLLSRQGYQEDESSDKSAEAAGSVAASKDRLTAGLELTARLLTGGLIVLLSCYSSLAG